MKSGIQSHVNIQSSKLVNKIQNGQERLNLTDNSEISDPLCFVSEPSIICERIDDIPLLIAVLLKLDLPNAIDKYYTPHVNHGGG